MHSDRSSHLEDIESDVLLLHSVDASDREFFVELAGDERVTRWVGDGHAWAHADAKARFDEALASSRPPRTGGKYWLIATVGPDRVGLLSLTTISEGVEVGYWIVPERWGRGYAGRLVKKALRLATTPHIFARVHPDNIASRKALERAGFALLAGGPLLTYSRSIDRDG